MKMIIAEKIGMTRIFDKDNKSIAVSILKAGPCKLTLSKNGNTMIEYQVKSKKITRQLTLNEEEKANLKDTKEINVNIFKLGEKVDIIGTSKGKGFAGVMKRHGFHGMPASHGHEKERIPGSIGCRFPQRVTKGRRMAGHMGNKQVTVKNLKIVDIDESNNLVALMGATPGYAGKILFLKSK